jgi:phosphohistidine phosphatase SixA
LVKAAATAEVSAIYTTQYKRTQQTAQPLATRLGVPLTKVEITRENAAGYAAALAKEILAKHAGRTVLIVGHSNTVPQLAEAFGVARPAVIDEATEFDRLLIVVVPQSGKARLIQARYGAGK